MYEHVDKGLFEAEAGRGALVEIDGPNIALPLREKAGLWSTLARIYSVPILGRYRQSTR